MKLATSDTWVELLLLLIAFVLSMLIGVERQIRQKSAGVRTHTLVGTGAAVFTLVSGFGFSNVLGSEVNLDPSRIAAQVVSGVGFLGAGVIFMRRDVVRGLTTAATIWMTAAIGMACGAGMPVLAVAATALHLVAVGPFSRLTRRLPSPDRRKIVTVRYLDGAGVLREILHTASSMGFEASVLGTEEHREGGQQQVRAAMRFTGRAPLQTLVLALDELEGVTGVRLRDDDDD
ncbi:putative Mg2+ transporter-C (MgtC) family protein [Kribbella voronezhensis]|uniref:Putative Mg2+ transporter-C (MgtC) family protein n=1 Tax=Kribbella voronezhensis TaxID=2512212 RepID=A0A4R7TF07_9ACTN|nr:MgtC/SapB family protein [Kribbella voronezhensis]TDU90379.1 putative Mg2+ transporter-C (MgtC) family protein [Kribbella voronezhensis]